MQKTINKIAQLPREVIEAITDLLMAINSSKAKLFVIELLPSQHPRRQMKILMDLIADRIREVRFRAVEQAGLLGLRKLSSRVAECLEDKDWLVRVQAAESLGMLRVPASTIKLTKALKDKHPLVRGAAAIALADLRADECLQQISHALMKERSASAQLRMHAALWQLGVKSHFDKLLKFLNARNYRDRCAAVSCLGMVENKKEKVQVRRRLKEVRRTEQTVAVRSSLSTVLQDLKG